MFQSTRPRGARHAARNDKHKGECFNPRARAGRDMSHILYLRYLPCFNPRARAGRDLTASGNDRPGRRFNPRARAGRDDC